MKSSSVVLACLLLTVSCSKIKDLEDRTEKMEKSTTQMSTTTNDMKDTTGVMYQQLRSGDSASLRLATYTHLRKSDTGMGDKIADASIYLKAMEFQLWTDNDLYDDIYMRNALYLDAANEFTKRICDVHSKIKIKKMNPTNADKVTSRNNDEMTFYAFAVALHMNHHFQDIVVLSDSKLQSYSMNDMIKKALAKDANQKALEEHEEILVNGENREVMIDLLKARVDMLSALALKNLTRKEDMTIGQTAKAAIFKITGGRLGEIDLPEVYDISNDATKTWTQKYLDAALTTKNFLRSIGVSKPLEKTLKSAFKKIDFNEKKQSAVDSSDDHKEVDSKKEEIKVLIEGLLE